MGSSKHVALAIYSYVGGRHIRPAFLGTRHGVSAYLTGRLAGWTRGTGYTDTMGRGTERGALRAVVALERGRRVLRVGGVIQSVHVDETYEPDIWDAMLPRRQPANALILGLGGGTIATLMTRRWGAFPITGVEYDPGVALLARRDFGLGRLEHVRVVVGDAFEYARTCAQRYDAICVDLYTAGKMAHGVLSAPFLRDLNRLLTPEGEAVFNLWRSPYLADQLRRIGRVLHIRETCDVDNNVVVHCTRSEVPGAHGAGR